MLAVLDVVMVIINVYIWLVIAVAILSWLIGFDVLNRRNAFVNMVADVLYRLTEPALRPLRRVVPSFGGLDITPAVLILLLYFLQRVIVLYVAPAFY